MLFHIFHILFVSILCSLGICILSAFQPKQANVAYRQAELLLREGLARVLFFYFEISASHQTMMVYYHVSLQKHLALANIKLSHFLFFQNLGSFWTAKRLVSCTILPKIASVNKWRKTSNGLSKSRTFWENEVSPRNWSCCSLRNKLFFFQIISKSKRQCKNDNIVIDNA